MQLQYCIKQKANGIWEHPTIVWFYRQETNGQARSWLRLYRKGISKFTDLSVLGVSVGSKP